MRSLPHRLPVGAAAAVRDPGAAARSDHRLERGDEPACRNLYGDFPVGEVVDVRLAVRHHDNLDARQFGAERAFERIRRPIDMHAVDGAAD